MYNELQPLSAITIYVVEKIYIKACSYLNNWYIKWIIYTIVYWEHIKQQMYNSPHSSPTFPKQI